MFLKDHYPDEAEIEKAFSLIPGYNIKVHLSELIEFQGRKTFDQFRNWKTKDSVLGRE